MREPEPEQRHDVDDAWHRARRRARSRRATGGLRRSRRSRRPRACPRDEPAEDEHHDEEASVAGRCPRRGAGRDSIWSVIAAISVLVPPTCPVSPGEAPTRASGSSLRPRCAPVSCASSLTSGRSSNDEETLAGRCAALEGRRRQQVLGPRRAARSGGARPYARVAGERLVLAGAGHVDVCSLGRGWRSTPTGSGSRAPSRRLRDAALVSPVDSASRAHPRAAGRTGTRRSARRPRRRRQERSRGPSDEHERRG